MRSPTAASSDIVVVLGWDRTAVETALGSRQVRIVPNPRWDDGMGTSIAAGIAALDAAPHAAFIVPGDMGLLTPQDVAKLIDASATAGGDRIVFPTTRTGEQRNPVLWPRRYFGALLALPPQAGAKALLQLVATECLPVPIDEAALTDIDTPAELELARERVRP